MWSSLRTRATRTVAGTAAAALGASILMVGGPVSSANAVVPTTPVTGFTVWQGGNAYPSGSEIVLQWNRWEPEDQADPITFYRITSGPLTQDCPSGPSPTIVCTITGLTAGQDYGFTIRPYNLSGAGTATATLLPATVTPYGAPTTPVAPDITVTTASSVSLELTAPAGNGRPISSYDIYVSTDGGAYEHALTTTSTTPTVGGLDTASHVYSFRITATNSGGPGTQLQAPPKTSQLSPSSTNSPTVPNAPTNVLVSGVGVDPSTATVTWTAPVSVPSHPTLGYTVVASPGGRTCSVNSATVSCTFAGANALDPGETYTFTVTATNDLGTSEPSIPSVPVLISTPSSAPTGLSGTAKDSAVALQWVAPSSPGGSPVTGYRIERSTNAAGPWITVNPDTGSAATTYEIAELTNGTPYYFQVTPINSSGLGSSAISAAVTPGEVAPPPTNVVASGISINPSSIDVSWTAAASPVGYPVTGYLVTASPGGMQCLVPTATVTCTFAGANALLPGETYTFTVAALNGMGLGSASAPSQAYLLGTVPAAPSAVSATSVDGGALVRWDPPINNGGTPVTGYRVQYATSLAGPWTTSTPDTESANPEYHVGGLTNGVAYYFRVAAINASGRGANAVSPTAVRPGKVPSAPTNVVAGDISTDPSSATVTWQAPIVTEGSEITEYTVTAAPGGMTCTTVTTSCIFTGSNALQPNLSYTFSVAATNSFGQGPSSIPSISYLIGSAPGAPADVVAESGLSSATLSWQPVGGPVTAYQVSLSTNEFGPWTVVTLDTGSLNPSYTVGGLTNGTEYWFQVVAVNASGPGIASTSNGVTPGGAPSAPQHVAVVSATSTTMTVGWLAPSTTNGAPVTSYTVSTFPGWQQCSTAALSCTLTGLQPGVRYNVWVDATNQFGTSQAATANPQAKTGTPPAAVTGLKGQAKGLGSAHLAWKYTAPFGAAPTEFVVRHRGAVVCRTTANQCTARGIDKSKAKLVVTSTNAYGSSVSVPVVVNKIETVRIAKVDRRQGAPRVRVRTGSPNQPTRIVQRVKLYERVVVKKTYKVASGTARKYVHVIDSHYGRNIVWVKSRGYRTAKISWWHG